MYCILKGCERVFLFLKRIKYSVKQIALCLVHHFLMIVQKPDKMIMIENFSFYVTVWFIHEKNGFKYLYQMTKQ